MEPSPALSAPAQDPRELAAQVRALRRIALAVANPGGPNLFQQLARELGASLGVGIVFISVFADESRAVMRTLSVCLHGRALQNFEYPLEGSPCAAVVGHTCQFMPTGLRRLLAADSIFAAHGMDSFAAYPLNDSRDEPIGLVVAMDRNPIAGGNAEHAEAMLKIIAGRAGAEIDRSRADEALRRSEASYRAIFDAAEDAILIHDWHTGEVLDVNPKACRSYGFTREEMRGISVEKLSSGVPPHTLADALRHMQAAKLGPSEPFEWHRRNKDGSLHWDEVRLKTVLIDGRPHLLAFARDITAQKKALEELRMREEQYRAIFEGSQDGLFVLNEHLHMLDANPAGLAPFGVRREELAGRAEPILMPCGRGTPDEVEERRQMVRRAIAGETLHIETLAWLPNGKSFDADLRVMPFRQGNQIHALAVVRDISERRRRDRELQRSEARLRATVEAAFDCVIGMDNEGRIVEFNATAERVLGHRRQDVLGRMLADVIRPERFRGQPASGVRAFNVHGPGPMVGRLVETTAQRADGTEIPVEVAISVASVPEGSIFVGHLRDITARRAAESERAALEAQLRQAQKMEAIGQLTGGLAHDFNNILTSVIGYVGMAQERPAVSADPALARQLGQARLAAQRACDHVAQLLAFSRPRRGERRTLAPGPVARQALQLLRPSLPASIAVRCEDPADPALQVLADPVQLEQVLFNLCINARDAIREQGTIEVRIGHSIRPAGHCASCSARLDGRTWVWVEVADDGCGVSPEVVSRMFEPFFTTKDVGRGTGLGLAMVHGIVHDHGGHLEVISTPGLGSRFRVLLPAAVSPEPAPGPGGAPAGGAASSPRLQGRILLVEDEPLVAGFMQELLAGWGLEVTLETDPRDAETRLAGRGDAFDVMLTDLTMPGMTGLALSQRAGALRPGLPVFLYTGNASVITPAELERSGVRALVRKPVDAPALRTLLQDELAATPSRARQGSAVLS